MIYDVSVSGLTTTIFVHPGHIVDNVIVLSSHHCIAREIFRKVAKLHSFSCTVPAVCENGPIEQMRAIRPPLLFTVLVNVL